MTDGSESHTAVDAALDTALSRILRPSDDHVSPPPGAVLGVQIAGRRSVRALGLRDTSVGTAPLPMTRATRHDLASLTKIAATTAALLRLVSDGELRLDYGVGGILPGVLLGDQAAAWRETTVRDLLLHRAGLQPWWPLYCETTDRDEAVRLALSLPRRVSPGEAHVYSDLGFIALGAVIERVAAEPLDAAVARLVHRPAALDSLAFTRASRAAPAASDSEEADVAASSWGDVAERRMVETGGPYPVPFVVSDFDDWRTELVVGAPNDGNAFHALDSVSGHAGLFGTVDDLLTLAAGFAEPDRLGLWSQDAQRLFESTGTDSGQAHGFRRIDLDLDARSVDLFWHPGFTGTAIGYVPALDAQVALATNRLHVAGTPTPTDALWRHALEALRCLLHPTSKEAPCR